MYVSLHCCTWNCWKMSKTTTSILGKLRCLGIFFTDGQRARQPKKTNVCGVLPRLPTIDPGWLKGYARPNSDLFLSSLHPPDVRPTRCLLIQARPWHQPKSHEGFAAPGRAWGTRPKVQEVEKFWSALGWTQPGWAIIWIIIQFSEGKLNRE